MLTRFAPAKNGFVIGVIIKAVFAGVVHVRIGWKEERRRRYCARWVYGSVAYVGYLSIGMIIDLSAGTPAHYLVGVREITWQVSLYR